MPRRRRQGGHAEAKVATGCSQVDEVSGVTVSPEIEKKTTN
jgi:hypothetical protein